MEKKELTLEELEKYSRKLNKENGFNCRHRAASLEAAKELSISLSSISSCLVGDLEELNQLRKIRAGALKNFIINSTENGKYEWVHRANATNEQLSLPATLAVSLEWGWEILVFDNPKPCKYKK